MTAVIDEQGNLFGYVNVIDALAVMVILAVVVAGFALVNQPAAPEPTAQQFAFTAEVTPVVATAMLERDPIGDAVLATENVVMTATDEVWRDGQYRKVVTLSFTATLPVVADEGTVRYQGDRLLIGQTYELDLGYTIVDGTLVDMEAAA